MEVKGTILQIIPVFIKDKFGEPGLEKWLAALPESSRKIFSAAILATAWYPIKESMIVPTKKLCELFYKGSSAGAMELGRYSADKALKGIYKVFIKFGSPWFIIKKAETVISTYYRPVEIGLYDEKEKSTIFTITKFDEMDELVELRIQGWIEKAIELSNTKKPTVKLIKSRAKKDSTTDYLIAWE